LYDVSDFHHTSVTCFEWSVNGMKLFSGDSAGVVVCTEFDFTVVRASHTSSILVDYVCYLYTILTFNVLRFAMC